MEINTYIIMHNTKSLIYRDTKPKSEQVRKVKKSSGEKQINEKYSKAKCLEEYNPELCGVRKSTAWWEQCGKQIGENGFVCNGCDKSYQHKGHWWRAGHMEVWGESSLSHDPEFWGEKHGKWAERQSQKWLVSGDLQDERDEEFQKQYPIEVPVVEESSEEESSEEESSEEEKNSLEKQKEIYLEKIKQVNEEKLKMIFSMFILRNEKKENIKDKSTIREMIKRSNDKCKKKEQEQEINLEKQRNILNSEKSEFQKEKEKFYEEKMEYENKKWNMKILLKVK